MIILTACLPGSPKTFDPESAQNELENQFPGIISKIFTPSYVCSFLGSDPSFDGLQARVHMLGNTRSELMPSLLEEVLNVFGEMLRAPYDILFIEGFARSESDVLTWRHFFQDRGDLFIILENLSEDKKPMTPSNDSFLEIMNACIRSCGSYFPDDHKGINRLFNEILGNKLERLAPVEL